MTRFKHKAVIFDIDGVLLDSFEANLKFYDDLMSKFGYTPPTKKDFEKLFYKTMKDVIKILLNSKSEEEIEKIYEAGKNREVSYHTELLTIPEKTEETLKILNQHYVLGITTSRILDSVYGMPQLASLKQYFKVVVSYEDTNNHKPHPDPLFLVSRKLNLLPQECVYIGDVESDVIAAKAAGMKIIFYSKKVHPDADASTSVFTELPDLIKKL